MHDEAAGPDGEQPGEDVRDELGWILQNEVDEEGYAFDPMDDGRQEELYLVEEAAPEEAEEEDDVAEGLLPGPKQWRIRPDADTFEVNAADFIQKFGETREGDSAQAERDAAKFIGKKMAMDWAEERLDFEEDDVVEVCHDIDFLSICGKPLLPLEGAADEDLISLGNIQFSVGWHYRAYREDRRLELDYSLMGRCYYLGTANDRYRWYLVWVPLHGIDPLAPPDSTNSGLATLLAEIPTQCLVQVFQDPRLSALGISPVTKLGSKVKVLVPTELWLLVQQIFMEYWPLYAARSGIPFFRATQPCFHVIEYGQKWSLPNDRTHIPTAVSNSFSAIFPSKMLQL